MRFTKYATQREERTINARLATAGLTASQASVVAGIPEGRTQISALTSATGVYTIVYLKAFTRLPLIKPTFFHATVFGYCTVTAQALTGCTIKCFDAAGVAQDATQLHVSITGFDVADEV